MPTVQTICHKFSLVSRGNSSGPKEEEDDRAETDRELDDDPFVYVVFSYS